MPYTPQQLRERYLNLPNDLREAVSSIDSSEIIANIGSKHGLTIDKTGDLATETSQVLLGLIHPNDFIASLANNLEVDKQKAMEIAEDINAQIFKPVRESLKKIHNIRDEQDNFPKDRPLGKEEILREIEENENEVPAILKGSTTASLPTPPAKVEQKYSSGMDPYREPVD